MSDGSEYKKEITEALRNPELKRALSRAISSYRSNTSDALKEFPHTIALAEEVLEIKKNAVGNIETLAAQAVQALARNQCKAYIAKTLQEALTIIGDLVGKDKLIVKGKSMTAEEIDLRGYLETRGNQVYETDLGEFIIQKMGSRPMHILAPAVHVTKEEVAKLFSRLIDKELKPDIPDLVAAARALLRDKFINADVGISGANVISADTGTMVIIENEGNIRLATGLPPVHIALVGIEKVVPALSDAFKVAEVTWRYANYIVPSYVSFISGPSKTGDIEKVTTYGAHGPGEVHVILLDAGRTELARHPVLKQALYCLRCGGCLYECPVFGLTAGHFGDKYFTGIGAVWAYMLTGDKEKGAAMAYTCLTCGRCKVRCPMKIDVPAMMIELRKQIACE